MPISDTVCVTAVGVPPSDLMLFASTHPFSRCHRSSLVPVPIGIQDPGAQGKLEAKYNAK